MIVEQKQTRIEQLVFDYFRERKDTEICYKGIGVYEVDLHSASAQQDFNGRKKLYLVFTQQAATDNPDCELITPGHLYLDVIRNGLSSDSTQDPRLTEAHIAANLLSQTAIIRVPDVEFTYDPQHVNAVLSFAPTFFLTYKVIYNTDERLENIVRLCWDPAKGEMRPELVERLHHVVMTSGAPSDHGQHSEDDMENILAKGQQEIETWVATDLKGFQGDVLSRLASDRERLLRHYKSQLDALDDSNESDRQRIQNQLAKDTQELEEKYQVCVSVQLLSIMKLWWPEVRYRLRFLGKYGRVLVDDLRYSARELQTDVHPCPYCGNRQRFHVCIAGQHLECGGNCAHEMKRCWICQDTMCSAHAHICSSCGNPVCDHDDDICVYGHHGDSVFCRRCLTQSFENKPICSSCLVDCDVCDRHFDRDHVGVCYLTNQTVCVGHDREPCGLVCSECGRTVTRTHAVQVVDGSWVCAQDSQTATCCDRIFNRSHIVLCALDTHELLCPDHAVRCANCGEAICQAHSYPLAKTPNIRVCHRCEVRCERCGRDVHYRPADLVHCTDCGQPMCVDHRKTCAVCRETFCDKHLFTSRRGEVLCSKDVGICQFCPPNDNRHRFTAVEACVECGRKGCDNHTGRCVQCGGVVCDEHKHISVKGEVLCKNHIGECAYCSAGNNIHRIDHLKLIAGGQLRACEEHRAVCPTCQRAYIAKPLLSHYERCAGCGRVSCRTNGCTPAYRVCPDCNQVYCQHCISGSRCVTCSGLRLAQILSNWPDLPLALTSVAQAHPESAKFIGEMLNHRDRLVYKWSENNTYRIIVFQCNLPFFARLFGHDRDLSQNQVRVVFKNNTTPIYVRIEPTEKG